MYISDIFDIDVFPSVYESNNFDLKHVAVNLVTGMKIIQDDQGYILGDLALKEGISPHRNINASPDELDYKLLMKSGMLFAVSKLGNPITITTGLPFSTYKLYKEEIKEKLLGENVIQFDTSTYTNGGIKKVTAEVDQIIVMPEVVGCALGLRKNQNENGSFFMLSLGYGTLEGIVSTPNGIVQRSALSVFGLRYAVNLMKEELAKLYYLDMKNEHQLDLAFREASIVLNRKRIDLTLLRKSVLQQYYRDVVSPAIRKAFDDNDFAMATKMFLAGGGSHYSDLVEMFNAEFDGFTEVEVAKNAEHLAAIGYWHQSLLMNSGDENRAVGIDIGNATTVVCTGKK